jgi:hypothetical protein
MLLSYLAEGGEARDTGVGEDNVELALLPFDLCEEPMEIAKVDTSPFTPVTFFPISFTAATPPRDAR